MKIKELTIRLNIISGGIVKLQKFKENHPQRLSQLIFRTVLIFSDFFIGIPQMRKIIKEMK